MSYKQQAPLPVNEGGTGDLTLTLHGVVIGETTSALGTTAAGTDGQVLLGSTGANPAFGTLTSSGGTISFTPGPASLNLDVSGVGIVTSITGTANQITASAATGAVTLSTPATFIAPGSIAATTTITASGMATSGIVKNSAAGLFSTYAATNHTVQIGNASGQLTSIANGTTNQVLIAQTGADPIWGAVPATAGVTSLTGTANQVTVSAPTGAVTLSTPSVFIAPGSSAAVTTVGAGTNFLMPTTSSTAGQIIQNGTTIYHTYGTNNTFIGPNVGNFTLTGIDNFFTGAGSVTGLTSGSANVCISAGGVLTSGSDNTLVGAFTGDSITDGSFNTILGSHTADNLIHGANNIIIGGGDVPYTGSAYLGSESSNIIVGNVGVLGDSNVLRLGTTGSGSEQVNKCFIAAIYNTAIGATSGVVQCDSSGQLGSSAGSNGQVLVGGGTAPAWANISAGTGIAITNGANTISIAATGAGFSWTTVTGTTQALAVENGYIMNNAGVVTGTLPASANVGDEIEIIGLGAGGWSIAQNAGQLIHLGSSTTTTGVGGSLASTNRYDSMTLVCIVTNTTWTVRGPVGNITVV
jgi:hypothetical protein